MKNNDSKIPKKDYRRMNSKIKKIAVIMGTRPEAIKLIPLINELKKFNNHFEVSVCVTAQHRQMLDQVLKLFNITPDHDLDLMANDQSLVNLSSKILIEVSRTLASIDPDYVVVQGDTSTTLFSSIAAFYLNIKVIHIEAGLRTNNKRNPFPEEMNRRLTSHISDLHFCPTESSKTNLLKEGISESQIRVVGNTVIDSLLTLVNKQRESGYHADMKNKFLVEHNLEIDKLKKIILFQMFL